MYIQSSRALSWGPLSFLLHGGQAGLHPTAAGQGLSYLQPQPPSHLPSRFQSSSSLRCPHPLHVPFRSSPKPEAFNGECILFLEAVGALTSSSREDSPCVRDLGRWALLMLRNEPQIVAFQPPKTGKGKLFLDGKYLKSSQGNSSLICFACGCYWFTCKVRLDDVGVKPKAIPVLMPVR